MTFRKGHRRIFGVLLAIFLLAGALTPMGLALAIDEAGAGTPAPSAPGPTPAASSTADSPEPSAPVDGGESSEMPDPTAGDAASQPPTPETPTPAPTEAVDPSEMPTPTETIVPTESPAPTETTLPTETPVPTESPLPTLTPAPALAVTATETGFTISGEMGEAGELTLQLDGAALRAEMLTGLPEGASATAENGALLVSLPAGAFALTLTPEWGEAAGTLVLTAQLLNLTDSATLERPAPAVEVLETSPALTAALAWQGGERPAAADYPAPKLLLALDGGEPQEPTAEDLSLLGLSALPEIQVAEDLSSLSLEAGALPARVRVDGAEHTAAWTLQPAALEGWLLTEEDGVWTYTAANYLEVEITAYSAELQASVVFYDFANQLDTRPDDFTARLQVSFDGGAYVVPDEALLPSLGLTELPSVQVRETENGIAFTVAEGTLPTKLTHIAADGTTTEHTAAWRIVPAEIAGYTLEEMPRMMLAQANGISARTTWAYTLNGVEYLYEIKSHFGDDPKQDDPKDLSANLYWADNNDEANARPFDTEYGSDDILTGFAALELMVTVTDEEGNAIPGESFGFREITEQDLRNFGMLDENAGNNDQDSYASLEAFYTNVDAYYDQGSGVLSFAGLDHLPTQITREDKFGEKQTYDIAWRIRPRVGSELDIDEEYAFFELNEENLEAVKASGRVPDSITKNRQFGWYYILRTDVTFNVQVNWGDYGTKSNHMALEKALFETYSLHVASGSSTSSLHESYTLKKLDQESDGEFGAWVDFQHAEPGSGPANGILTIHNTWKYQLDGTPINYTVHSGKEATPPAEGPENIIPPELEEGDYFKVEYDNTAAPNHGSDTSQLWPGGTIKLTLTGKTDYTANKIWLDGGNAEQRPTATYELWRYRYDEDNPEGYRNASPVRVNGQVITFRESGEPNEDGPHTLEPVLTEEEIEALTGDAANPFPKYDAEGYRYVYVLREYLKYGAGDAQYAQVFGIVQEDGTVAGDVLPGDDVTRHDGDTYLYHTGTLSNRRVGQTHTRVTKTWEAAAFQAVLEDVTVELTLEYRPLNEDGTPAEEEWRTYYKEDGTPLTQTIQGFYAENLSVTQDFTVDRFGPLGRELEFRWVETAVRQNGNDCGFSLDEETGKGSFTLTQSDLSGQPRRVQYESLSDEDPYDRNHTIITNTLDDEIDYFIDKYWWNGDAEGEAQDPENYDKNAPEGVGELTFAIQVVEGEQSVDFLTGIKMDGTPDTDYFQIKDAEGNLYYYSETDPWDVTVQGLPEYDENGRAVEYVLAEDHNGDSGWSVVMQHTERDEDGNYITTIYNGPGDGNAIIVRKAWIDDGDVIHREEVTIGVFLEETNEQIDTVILGENAMWYQIVGIGAHERDDVYILETKMGNEDVPLQQAYVDPGNPDATTPDYETPKEPVLKTEDPENYTTIQFAGPDHYYEATYSMSTFAGYEDVFTVTNRRLGIIDLTVTKTWVDGDNSETELLMDALAENNLALALYLKFDPDFVPEDNDYEINYVNNTITLGNEVVDIRDNTGKKGTGKAILPITRDQAVEGETKYHFFNLPKYDLYGASVRYTVEEVVVKLDENGNVTNSVVTDSLSQYPSYTDETTGETYTLQELWNWYTRSYDKGEYVVAGKHERDTHAMQVTNSLVGAKDVQWHKQWADRYAYETGVRPDIFLNIYAWTPDSPNAENTPPRLVYENYRWTPNEKYPGNDEYSWTVTIEDLPKYDAQGYEIFYYATEHSNIDWAQLDYTEVQYAFPDSSAPGDWMNIGTQTKLNESYDLDLNYVVNVGSEDIGTDAPGAHYALREDGMFINHLSASITLQGRKVWSSLPNGWQAKDMPTITFDVYQYADENSNGKRDDGEPLEGPVAWLTISNWTNWANGTFQFEIKYLDENIGTIDEDGTILTTSPDGEEAKLLPKYRNKDGVRFGYVLQESSVEWPEKAVNGELSPGAVFESTVQEGSYIAQNTYDPERGFLQVKKHLQLPVGEEGEEIVYPAVQFDLYRTYVDNAGAKQPSNTGTPGEYIATQTWTSAQVEDAAKKAGEEDIVSTILTFENLPLYAPNGSPYTYTIVEAKEGFLEGYDTWAAKEDVDAGALKADEENRRFQVSDLTPTKYQYEDGQLLTDENGQPLKPTSEKNTVHATFLNERDSDHATLTLTGKKVWADFDDALGLRPEDGSALTIVVSRSAPAQSGQGNSVEPQTLKEDEDYEITWTKGEGEDSNTWTYTITGAKEGELEVYAPNGRPWTYTVKEVPEEPYEVTPENGVHVSAESGQQGEEGDSTLTATFASDLINSLKVNIPFSKQWMINTGTEETPVYEQITDDYFGYDLYITFKLQVREEGNETWQDAAKYFPNALGKNFQTVFPDGKDTFTQEIHGAVNETASGSFDGLPSVIGTDGTGSYTVLEYRAVETRVRFGKEESAPSVDLSVDKDGNYTFEGLNSSSEPFTPLPWKSGTGNAHRNVFDDTDLTVRKVWENDNDNIYGSRPASEDPSEDWEVVFLIQSREQGSGDDWQAVTVRDVGFGETTETTHDLTVTIRGRNSENTASVTIRSLPGKNIAGKTLEYRAVELQPGAEPDYDADDIVSDGGTFYGTYTVAYVNSDGTTTATNTLNTTEISAEKKWNVQEEGRPPVTLHLQYRALEDGKEVWKDVKTFGGESCTVTLDGEVDSSSAQPYYEDSEWHAVWKDLPQALPGSELIDGKTQYKVVEDVPSGFLQENSSGEPGNEGEFTFINVPETSYTVTKSWHTTTGTHPEVTVQLYRTTDENLVGALAETPGVEEVKGRTAELSGNTLTHTFQDLPKYEPGEGDNPKGALYYYVLETTASNGAWEVHYDHTSEANTTTIRNVGKVTVSGTKTWKDNNDAYHTRPDSITLQLYRTTDTGENKQWTEVGFMKVCSPWTYEFKDLPYADEKGNPYTYRVAEMNENKEIAEGGTLPAVEGGDPEPTYPDADYTVGYDGKDYKWNITNTLTETIEIPVKKTWVDGGSGANERPDSITFLLYANGEQVAEHTVQAPGLGGRIVDFLTDTGDIWEFKFTTNDKGEKLPRFDEDGEIIDYTVDEIVVDGYKTTEVSITKPDHPHLGFTLVNTKMTQLTVQKIWRGTLEDEEVPVTFYVWRSVKGGEPERVAYASGMLNEGNQWSVTVEDLEAYDENGKAYTYVAQEVHIGGIAVEDADFTVEYTVEKVNDPVFTTVFHTEIINIDNMEITGTKTWVDNGNAYDTRPEKLTLTLYRSVAGGQEKVVNATPTWRKPADGNVWTYTYSRLPKTDKEGNLYTYRVEETLPEPAENGDHYERLPEETGYNFTNVLKGTVDIPVTKTWVDNHDGWGKRPETVTIRLYRHTEAKPEKQLVEERTFTTDAGALEKLWNAITGQTDDEWICTFAGLPKYDDTGARYVYTVEETVPEDYEAAYDQEQFEITNTRDGDLLVEKEVTGSDGQKNREFHFTVTLSGTSVTGIQAETITGAYGDMTFTNGVAEFTLKHGEQKRAEDLPAGLTYTVVETDANTNRYRTTYTGETGTIPAGDTAVTHVENRRNRQYYPDYTEEPEPTPPRIPEESWRPPHYDDWHDVPRTGDTMNLSLYVVLAVVSAAGLTTLLILMRRKRR